MDAIVKLYGDGKLIDQWVAKDNKIIYINNRMIAFLDKNTNKLIRVSGAFIIESSNDSNWF